MGNRKNQLSWTWPLISLEWIPDILSSFGNLLEPSWEGLRRAMTARVENKAFSNRLFGQLQCLLTEMGLVEDNSKHISPSVEGNFISVRDHLLGFFSANSDQWADFYRFVSRKKLELHFSQLKENPPRKWSEIANYSVFKQWSEFFQYLGFGFFLSHDCFIPESAITNKMIRNPIFIERCLKAIGDPRYLTGYFSLHTEADFLAWTIGEERLPITDDPNLFPRIPHEVIVQEWKNNTHKGSWRTALSIGREKWAQSIEEILSVYPFSNLTSLIYTCKYLLDYFLFGRPSFNTDFLDQDKIFSVRKRWNSVKHFMITEQIWKVLPNLYRDITRLYWGISYYRSSLHKPYQQNSLYNNEYFGTEYTDQLRRISIKCYRSKRTLAGILKSYSLIFKSLTRLKEKKVDEYYESESKQIYNNVKKYLPSNPLETSELLNQLKSIMELHPDERLNILNAPNLDISIGYRSEPMLNLCFWVHRYYELSEHPHIKSLDKIQKRLDEMERKLIKEFEYYEKGMSKWQEACERFKDKMRGFRTN